MLAPVLTRSALVLIAANVVAVAVAYLAGWGLGDLFRLYLVELVAVGVLTLVRIGLAARPGALAKSRGYQGILFVAHFGTVCVLYLALLSRTVDDFNETTTYFWLVVWLAAIPLIAAHVVSLRWNFLRSEAKLVSSMQASLLPYARELPVQLPVFLIAMLPLSSLSDRNAMLLVALLKLVLDTGAHIAHHRRLANAADDLM